MAFNLAVLTFYISPFLTEKLKQIPKHPERESLRLILPLKCLTPKSWYIYCLINSIIAESIALPASL